MGADKPSIYIPRNFSRTAKVDNLKLKAAAYRAMLQSMRGEHPEIGGVLAQLNDFFVKIENGEVTLPCDDCYASPFHPDINLYYGPGTALSVLESEFICALEDWHSKSWFKALS